MGDDKLIIDAVMGSWSRMANIGNFHQIINY